MRTRVDPHGSFRQLSSTIINLGQMKMRVVESPSRVRERKRKLSLTLMKNLSRFKVDERAQESVRVHESFGPSESEDLIMNSHQFSSSFGLRFRCSSSKLGFSEICLYLRTCFLPLLPLHPSPPFKKTRRLEKQEYCFLYNRIVMLFID